MSHVGWGGWGVTRERTYKVGAIVGWGQVVEPSHRGRILIRCLRCKRTRVIFSSRLSEIRRLGRGGRCLECLTDPAKRGAARAYTVCAACDRRRARNGYCSCGWPAYLSQTCPGCGA